MSWRDRDYAKFNDEERRRFFGSSGAKAEFPASAEGHGHSNALPTRARRRRGRRSHASARLGFFAAFGIAVAAVAATAAYVHANPLHGPHTKVKPAVDLSLGVIPTPAIQTSTSPSKTLNIRWRRSDLAPAANAGRICVTSKAHGRICASYVVGERPADNLTRRIESLRLHVQSSG